MLLELSDEAMKYVIIGDIPLDVLRMKWQHAKQKNARTYPIASHYPCEPYREGEDGLIVSLLWC